MTIDTVIIKASYDLFTEEEATRYSVSKFADDVSKGRQLTTVKLARSIDSEGFDFLKFNFPVCGNLSSADLMVIYCALNGFDTYVVGNSERCRRNELIKAILHLDMIHSIQELDFIANENIPLASKTLSFTHTQRRGFAALPDEKKGSLVLEMAGDQPLLYNTFRHAMDLSHDSTDLAINLNAVTLMKTLVPTFVRNGYDKVVNSRGEAVVIKENNNFAQTIESMEANAPVFDMIYKKRNGGRYLGLSHLLSSPSKLLSSIVRAGSLLPHLPELIEYLKQRRTLHKPASFKVLNALLNFALSPSIFRDRVHADATNDDIFSCWDMDGLNNDYLGYHCLFQKNYEDLGKILPFADEVYAVDEVLEKKGADYGLLTRERFKRKYQEMVDRLVEKLNDGQYLRQIGFDEETIFKIKETDLSAIKEKRFGNPALIKDLERHLAEKYLPGYKSSMEKYLSQK